MISEILILINFKKEIINTLSKIYIIISIIISLKAFYILHIAFFKPIIIFLIKKYSINKIVKIMIINNFFYLFTLTLFLVLTTYFFSTGCLIYPVSQTCFDNFIWSINIPEVKKYSDWYELWAKGGAPPNFGVSNPDDDILGCGGTIAYLRSIKIKVKVLFLSGWTVPSASIAPWPICGPVSRLLDASSLNLSGYALTKKTKSKWNLNRKEMELIFLSL